MFFQYLKRDLLSHLDQSGLDAFSTFVSTFIRSSRRSSQLTPSRTVIQNTLAAGDSSAFGFWRECESWIWLRKKRVLPWCPSQLSLWVIHKTQLQTRIWVIRMASKVRAKFYGDYTPHWFQCSQLQCTSRLR